MIAPTVDSPPKRTWIYIQKPATYGIAECPTCGTPPTEWSEFTKHVWCGNCQVDYVPKHNGVFDGPIMLEVCHLMGMRFERVDLATRTIIPEENPAH